MKRPDVKFEKEYSLFIGGQWVKASDGATMKAYCPADGSHLADIAQATAEDVDKAVKAAWEAFPKWSKTTKQERAKILNKIADVIDENAEHLAMVETLDNGKPIRETLGVDIPEAANHFRYFAGVIEADEGSLNVLDKDNLSLVLREPLGVVGQIVPWNFPFLMGAWKLAPVLAAGDCTVLKPSSTTSLSVLELIKLIEDIVPAGVINIITGSGSKSGQYMLDHEGFSKFAFTGSTEVGYNVARAAADKLIPATLELGGKSANIFFKDCDMDLAIDGLLLGILFNQGQVCCAGSRIFVQEDIYDEFVKRAVEEFKKVKVGLPWDPKTQMGAQINKGQVSKILKYIDIAKDEGAEISAGGCQILEDKLSDGFFMMPTLITNVTNDMTVAREEIFGPVASVIKFKYEEDVIKMANDSEYGLGGAVWTRDINKAIRVSKAMETGRVWVNTYNSIPAGAPFGGYKKSGIGRETHKMILDAYSQVKNIIINTSEKPSGFYNI
ncbi:acyl-CoA reductase-like NAD-dependent aldehyde dehydrogenase [Peptoniphilus stercorisuis]|uniref:Acyl-CoA reductase-like NAD-dependent aldehyde dehydrogenase n=1 Tax=Peptoniphilus stercorisuis TaxID=1436965 RepID=A0ABS4KDE0_9FIRM|nr:aldehyde dehydrogenase family protein [Peptoniphilus stercorisuis]MBP2025797.1 acyl-CoA reductase-like NAD-dependent aldehyde dehydrogenase [Peptoniphilus stercorisuis]